MKTDKVRLDVLVQERAGVSRSKAQGMIQTGSIRGSDGTPLTKPGMQVAPDFVLEISEGPRFVSRGGEKLLAGLEAFTISFDGETAIDVGASTGGFTDCLLQHNAARVYAVDVGYGQLHWNLRQDERVVVFERTNIRNLEASQLDDLPTRFVADCSFISLRLVLEALGPLLAKNAEGIVLIKPQFEAGREQVGKGGVVRDPEVHEQVIENVRAYAPDLGFAVIGVIPSPLTGPAGNREFLAHLRFQATGGTDERAAQPAHT